jgi:hypothetical protein
MFVRKLPVVYLNKKNNNFDAGQPTERENYAATVPSLFLWLMHSGLINLIHFDAVPAPTEKIDAALCVSSFAVLVEKRG